MLLVGENNEKAGENGQNEKEKKIEAFKFSSLKAFCTVIAVILSCGILLFIMSLKKKIWISCTHTRCEMKDAEKILITDYSDQEFVVKVQKSNHQSPATFYYKKLKYAWREESQGFEKIGGLQVHSCGQLHLYSKGLHADSAQKQLVVYGMNTIDVEVKSVLSLILREIRNPFYFYQVFSVLVWSLQMYYLLAVCTIFLSTVSISATVWETRKQSRALKNAMKTESMVTVYRDGKRFQLSSKYLVPGDIIVLSSLMLMMCDAILLNGSCVVNESMLTGESKPITKVAVSTDCSEKFSPQIHKRSILSCGTEVLQSRTVEEDGALAVVYCTGFSTAKGELVRAILYPKPIKIQLHADLIKCAIMYFIIGLIPIAYTIYVGTQLDLYTGDNIIFTLNVVTFFVPPTLPAVMTSINEQAQRRLKKLKIFCLNARYIHLAGGLDVVCFDKTGTLTEDRLDIQVVVPVNKGNFEEPLTQTSDHPCSLLSQAMATCHELSRINNNLVGQDLDLKMFRLTGWELIEPKSKEINLFEFSPPRIVLPKLSEQTTQNNTSIAILKQFPFESASKSMSVVTQTQGAKNFTAFLKGAPELVVSLSRPDTVPENLNEVLSLYSSQGFRVIGFGMKVLPSELTYIDAFNLKRTDLEHDLEFLGLLVLENKLKAETVPALRTLKQAAIRSVMVTGDNILTGISVGRKCGIVNDKDPVIIMEAKHYKKGSEDKLAYSFRYADIPRVKNESSYRNDLKLQLENKPNYQIAIEGSTFKLLVQHDQTQLERVALKGVVLARMSPEDKLVFIEHLQMLGYQVGMCGDGANDCGALKAAHTGVSLSMAEASVAAPFTSTQQNIECIPTLIREGRSTLVSFFDSYRYMLTYTTSFMLAVLILFWDGQRPSDGAYLTTDVVVNILPPFLFGATGAWSSLSKEKPSKSIFSFLPLFSVFSFCAFQAIIYGLVRYFCTQQSWYVPFIFDKDNPHSPEASFSGTVVLTTNLVSYIAAGVIFSSGPPYRNTFFSNKLLVAFLTLEFLLVALINIYPPEFIKSFLNLKRGSMSYHLTIFIAAIAALLVCYLYEKLFIQSFIAKRVLPFIRKMQKPITKFEKLQQAMDKRNSMFENEVQLNVLTSSKTNIPENSSQI